MIGIVYTWKVNGIKIISETYCIVDPNAEGYLKYLKLFLSHFSEVLGLLHV